MKRNPIPENSGVPPNAAGNGESADSRSHPRIVPKPGGLGQFSHMNAVSVAEADIWRTAKAIDQAGCRDVLIINTPEFVRFIVTTNFPNLVRDSFMKTGTIVATLLIAAAVSADARFASPYPRKAVSPDDVGHWIVINGNSWPYRAESELTTASPSGGGPDAQKSSPAKKEKTQLKTGMFHSGFRQEPAWASRSDS